MISELEQQQQSWITVEPGTEFIQQSESAYQIDPANPAHYHKLMAAIAQPIAQILHLWTYDAYAGEVDTLERLEQTQNLGVYSLLFLVQAIAPIKPATTIRLGVISSHT